MQIDRGSMLVGFVLGLATAAILMAGSVALFWREPPTPWPTVVPSHAPVARQTEPATPAPTATREPTPTVTPFSYQTVDVPARKYVVVELPAQAGMLLELTVTLDGSIICSLFEPDGTLVDSNVTINGSRSFRRYSEQSGRWVLKLDNAANWFFDTQVMLQYRSVNTR